MTLQEHYARLLTSFGGFKGGNAAQEARWLLEAALGQPAGFLRLHPDYSPTAQESEKIEHWASRRLTGEPLSRLKGEREFWSLSFHLSPDTLDPRPDTEILVEATLAWIQKKHLKAPNILDFGTGSGCILISLLHECSTATGVGVDISEEALKTAHENAIRHKVAPRATFLQGNWGEHLTNTFDIIVSNPPYISLQDKPTLDQNVKDFDPPRALFGGEDGLAAYRHLRHDMKRLLKPGGLAALEIGATQRLDVEALFHTEGFQTLFALQDLAGHDRVLGFTWIS